MAALEPLSTHLTSPKTEAELRVELGAALEQLGATLTGSADGSLQAVSGKKLGTRFLGAMFVPDSWLPLHHSITFTPDGDDIRVDITVKDDFGVGLRAGFAKKYTRHMTQRLEQLTAAVA